MTVKRFELNVNQHNQCDIVDLVESKEKNAICIYNDLGDYYFSSAKALCKLLNELHEENQMLHKMNADAIDFMYDNFDLSIIFTDRELNDICNEMGGELSEKGIKIDQLEKENEQLKQFIDDLTTKGTGRIDLANGYSYRVSAVLTNWKGDVE